MIFLVLSLTILATVLVPVITYPNRSNLRKEGFVMVHSFRVQSMKVWKSRKQEQKTMNICSVPLYTDQNPSPGNSSTHSEKDSKPFSQVTVCLIKFTIKVNNHIDIGDSSFLSLLLLLSFLPSPFPLYISLYLPLLSVFSLSVV